MFQRFFRSLYWKVSALFIVLLVLIGAVYVYVTLFTAEMYVQETAQRVNASLAQHVARRVGPVMNEKNPSDSLRAIFKQLTSVNPGIEIYLLDSEGNILVSSAPPDQGGRTVVSLTPLKQFIAENGKHFVMGDDPRGAHKEKVFSAAYLMKNEKVDGFVYVILRGEEYDSFTQMLLDSYILLLGTRSLVITLVSAGIVAVLILGLLMRRLRKMRQAVHSFERGDYQSRIAITSNDELDQLAQTFNSMADTIVENMEDLKLADAQRRELVANISHDLKTPITSIQGYLETLLLKNASLSEEDRTKYLQIILQGTERLSALVDQILELSKLEAGQTLPAREPFSMGELVQDIIQKFQPQAEKQRIRLRALFPKDLPPAYADIGMIERALQNLIDNAIRYTPEIGVVTVQLTVDEEKITAAVSDTGRGLAEEDLPHIFDRFYRAEKSRARDSGGTGLGLAIAQKILEAHGSNISVKSTMSAGTTFSFYLPVHRKN